ncbi:response regulator [Ramlibacter sp. AW1]|uniref:Response regulator n=1 Tax=Ramlibacter aurantiacus TaxID=2801330 RepID=A0A937D766_9BURK|nr:response regulator [Ramlibacter aurantiacus]
MNPVRVLLVDDELSSAEVLGLILSREGYEVTMAADGQQALLRLRDTRPDLVITDFMMPVLNGAELVNALRKLPEHAHTPVLLMSGAPEAALRAYQVDYQAFMRKPFELDAFLATVARLAAQARPAS